MYEIVPWRSSAEDTTKACTFFDYAPQVFEAIRKSFNIKKDEYSRSLGPEQILQDLWMGNFSSMMELFSSGKSGSFFYYTADGKYMLKTIPHKEFSFLKKILPQYYAHIIHNPHTFITRILGMHKMIFTKKKRTQTRKKIYFMIMNNVFNTTKKVDIRFDLKGSTQGRRTISE